ncbi:MAG TPA: hypothetical protein VLK33_16700 [Terriglobales bacterium]|nr:hypothetical protein [Terriglobales bacterium]
MAKAITIDLNVVFPFFGEIFLRVDSSRRTSGHARPTANAAVWVDVELRHGTSIRFIRSRMDRSSL